MANIKNTKARKPRTDKNNDATVYKVMASLVIMCVAVLGLRALRGYYATLEGFTALYGPAPYIAVGGLVVAAVCGAALFLLRNKIAGAVSGWGVTLGLIAAATGWIMRESGVEGFPFLYFLCFAVLVQYIILQLYRWEFFLFSLSTVTAGGLFFCLSRGMYFTGKNLFMLAALVLVVVGTSLIIYRAYRNKGWFVLGKIELHVLNAKSIPLLLFAVNALWVLCTVAVLVFGALMDMGGLFAYYCMFAAIAVEFIAAVYYTFQLN